MVLDKFNDANSKNLSDKLEMFEKFDQEKMIITGIESLLQRRIGRSFELNHKIHFGQKIRSQSSISNPPPPPPPPPSAPNGWLVQVLLSQYYSRSELYYRS